mmetsp:Transcript_2102/g.5348  ORF Transcript_2102/g.5348 Transcript_2102/m.5348 type:complete len:246 (-) Transcript_2102:2355-3092(-)
MWPHGAALRPPRRCVASGKQPGRVSLHGDDVRRGAPATQPAFRVGHAGVRGRGGTCARLRSGQGATPPITLAVHQLAAAHGVPGLARRHLKRQAHAPAPPAAAAFPPIQSGTARRGRRARRFAAAGRRAQPVRSCALRRTSHCPHRSDRVAWRDERSGDRPRLVGVGDAQEDIRGGRRADGEDRPSPCRACGTRLTRAAASATAYVPCRPLAGWSVVWSRASRGGRRRVRCRAPRTTTECGLPEC